MGWELLLKAGLPNWSQAVMDDNIPDEINLQGLTKAQINKSYADLDNVIKDLRTPSSVLYKKRTTESKIRGRIGFSKAQVNVQINKLVKLKDQIKEPMPKNIGSLKFKNKLFKNAFPRGHETWIDWVQDTTNNLYQDFADKPTVGKLEVIGQFLDRLKSSEDSKGRSTRPKNLFQNWMPTPDRKDDFAAGLNKFKFADISTPIFDDIRNQFNITAEASGEIRSRPVETRAEEGTGAKDVGPSPKEAFKDQTKAQRKRAKAAEGKVTRKTRKRTARGGEEGWSIEYGKKTTIPTLVSSENRQIVELLPYREFLLLMQDLHKSKVTKGTALEHFTERGIRILHQFIASGSDGITMVGRIDEIRKGIQHRKEKKPNLSNFIYAYIKSQMKKANGRKSFSLLDVDNILDEESFTFLINKRRSAGAKLTVPQTTRLETHFDAVEDLYSEIRKEINKNNKVFSAPWQNYVRQKQNADAEAKELIDELKDAEKGKEGPIRDKIREIYQQMDLEEKPSWELFGITDGELKSREIEEAFDLLNSRFAKGIFITFFFRYWELVGTDWDRYIHQWVPSMSGWKGYWHTGQIFEKIDSNTFPKSFKALLTIINVFVGRNTMNKYSTMMESMMDEFMVNIDEMITTMGGDPLDKDEKQIMMQWMVEEKRVDGKNGKQQVLDMWPELSEKYTSCLGIRDNLLQIEELIDKSIKRLPTLIFTVFNDVFEKISEEEFSGSASVNNQAKTLKEKLINMKILTKEDE